MLMKFATPHRDLDNDRNGTPQTVAIAVSLALIGGSLTLALLAVFG
jgi:hypothetical protein